MDHWHILQFIGPTLTWKIQPTLQFWANYIWFC